LRLAIGTRTDSVLSTSEYRGTRWATSIPAPSVQAADDQEAAAASPDSRILMVGQFGRPSPSFVETLVAENRPCRQVSPEPASATSSGPTGSSPTSISTRRRPYSRPTRPSRPGCVPRCRTAAPTMALTPRTSTPGEPLRRLEPQLAGTGGGRRDRLARRRRAAGVVTTRVRLVQCYPHPNTGRTRWARPIPAPSVQAWDERRAP